MSNEIETNLYALNKMLMGQIKGLTKEDKDKLVDDINEMDDGAGRQYFMLLSNEERDYTVFNLCKGREEALGKEVLECLENRGEITSSEVKRDSEDRIIAIEIWVGDKFYALFPYDLGVVEC